MLLKINLNNPAFNLLFRSYGEEISVSRADPDDNNTLTLIESFTAVVRYNGGKNRLQGMGTIENNSDWIVLFRDNTQPILKGDRITRADGTYLYVFQSLENILHCQEGQI